MNIYITSNIRLLRKRRKRTQEDVALAINMNRATYCGIELGKSMPGIETLVALSNYFRISIDTLIRIDLARLSEFQLSELERGNDTFIKGSNLRVLASTHNSDNKENIELVPEKAKAGYALGYADPTYINQLPRFQLPFLSSEKKYRTFQISGDSMLPVPDGAWITAEFVQDWDNIRSGRPYIILTLDDGIVFKIADNLIRDEGKLRLYSLNPFYKPYDVYVSEIKEVWAFANYISTTIPEGRTVDDTLHQKISDLSEEIQAIKNQLKEK